MERIILKICVLALVSMMAAPALANTVNQPAVDATPHSYWFLDTTSWSEEDFRIRLTTGDFTDPNGGAVRYWVRDTPTEVNTYVQPYGGYPYPGMSDIIGADGMVAVNNAAWVQTYVGQTEPTHGEECIFVMELDANKITVPRVYIDNGVQIGTVPHGYIWAGSDLHDSSTSDQEVLPSGSPPTKFFEVLEMAAPNPYDPVTWTWAGLKDPQPSDVAGNVLGQIESWALMESYMSDDGPWTQVGQAAFGNSIIYTTVSSCWYCAVPIWKGGVRSLVYSEPTIGWWMPSPEVWNLGVSPDPHNGNITSEYVTISADIIDPLGIMDILTGQYRIDGGAWIAFPQNGYSPLHVTGAYNFPNGFMEGTHSVEVRGYEPSFGYGEIASDSFTITDTTAPVAGWLSTPPAIVYITSPLNFVASYGDFCAMDFDVADSYLLWRVNNGSWTNAAWTNQSFAWGSYNNVITYTLPGGMFMDGDYIEYRGQVKDKAGTPNTRVLSQGSAWFWVPSDPYIAGIEPGDGATGVATDADVVVTWSEAMYLSVGTVSIVPAPLIAGTWAWSAGDTVYTYSGATWDISTEYTLTFTSFESGFGAPAVGDLVKQFTTSAVPIMHQVDDLMAYGHMPTAADVRLTWSEQPGATSYNIYRSLSVTGTGFDFGTIYSSVPLTGTGTVTWDDVGAYATADNYAWVVRAVYSGTEMTVDLDNIAYKLIKIFRTGTGSVCANYNYFALPYRAQFATAQTLLTDLRAYGSPTNSISSLNRWNQDTSTWWIRTPIAGENWANTPGMAYYAVSNLGVTVTYKMVGAYDSSVVLNMRIGNGSAGAMSNYIAVPYHITYTVAQNLLASLRTTGNPTNSVMTINRWNQDTSVWDIKTPISGINFAIVPGEGYMANVNQQSVTWTAPVRTPGP